MYLLQAISGTKTYTGITHGVTLNMVPCFFMEWIKREEKKMNLSKETKYFSALSHNQVTYHFAVNQEKQIYCLEFSEMTPASILELKPNFVLRSQNGCYICSLVDYLKDSGNYNPNANGENNQLVFKFNIDDELFAFLIENRMLSYSTDMAELYGYDPQYAYDKHFNTSAFKSSRNNPIKKSKRLARQKNGFYR